MVYKILISLAIFMLAFVGTTKVFAKDGNSGRGEGGDNRIRVESNNDQNNIRFEVREVEEEAEDNEALDAENAENAFEITDTR